MEESTQQHDEQAQDSTAQPITTLGMTLRDARKRLGLSVGDVANQIKFAPRQIEALEADDFSAKPEATFLRGFVRSYGRLLQLDEAALFDLLPETKVTTLSAAPAPNEMVFSTARAARRPNLVWMSGALLVIAIALGFEITNVKSPAKSDKDVSVEASVTLPSDMAVVAEQPAIGQAVSAVASVAPAAEVALPTVAKADVKVEVKKPEVKVEVKQPEVNAVAVPPAIAKKSVVAAEKIKPTPAVKTTINPVSVKEAAPNKEIIPIDTLLGTQPVKPISEPATSSESSPDGASLRIEFGAESWAEIKDKNGKSLSSKINASGSELNLKGSPPFTLVISHAKSARLSYKGKQVDLTHHINKYSTSDVAHVTLE